MPLESSAPGEWRPSSYSGGNGNCVEVAVIAAGNGVAVRDTKDRTIPAAVIPARAWSAFLTHLKG
ncbi:MULTISPECIES: DUF397 domain-containing protein [Streptomyces]|uniref:DUF397 domain-containing protein n=1 Tax=Streptomyces harbinensis TaxID=1176198 RepID=A0A1I6W5Y5_9ACTN|nr:MULTISPECIES: DUF397 domain-containing protein [Streptomyces]QKV70358.1 DUF397 domain-containing protein [Streptomyces harbinensis]SFT21396.1 protein of unknown function [Streptomyces harbinensis]